MKVKNLIIALGVTGAFVACSQEDLLNENQILNNDRPVVGAIGVIPNQGVESRWAYSGGFSFDASDYMGACLMDVVKDLNAVEWADKYTLSNYISSNYKYGYKDNWTNGDAIMSEGNYFFYLPYNDKLKNRTGLTYDLTTDQYAYDNTVANPTHNGNMAWLDNQMFIGYDAILEGDQQATPNMVEVFAKPRFNVNYTGSKNVVIERIVVLNETEPFVVKGQLDIDDVTAAKYEALSPTVTEYEVAAGKTASDVFAMYNQALADVAAGDLELAEEQKIVNPLAAMGFISQIETAPSISLNVVPAKEISALMVMPACTQTATNMKIQVYTNVGWVVLDGVTADLLKPVSDTKLTYKNITKLHNLKAGDGVKADAVEINFSDEDITVPNEVTVATTAQLESVMRWYATTTADFTLTVNLVGEEVELSSKVYDIIKGNEELTVEFDGTLIIPATAAADAWTTVGAATKVINKGVQNIENTAALTIAYAIQNDGELNVSALNTTNKTITFTKSIQNNGDLNVKTGKVTVNSTISNYKNLTVDSGAEFVASKLNNNATVIENSNDYEHTALVTNNGTMSFGGKNQVVIENNGKIYLTDDFTNTFKAEIKSGASKTNGYKGVINNNLLTSYIYAKAAVTNKGDINNYGFIYSQAGGSIENQSYIKANEGSTTYITTNTVKGEIELEKRDTETTVITDNGFISYTLTAEDLNAKGQFAFDKTSDKFNTLRVGMNMKLAKGADAPKSLILTGATVSCPTDLTGITAPAFTSIKVESGINVIKGIQVSTESLAVSEDALIQIPSLSTFGVKTALEVEENAEVLVGGIFKFVNGGTVPAVDGILSKAGDGSYVWDWNGSAW